MPQNTDMDLKPMTNLDWLIEGKVLILKLNTDPDQNDAMPDQMIIDYMDSVTSVVDLIVSVPPLTTQGSPSLKQMTGFKHQQHPRLGYIVIVGLTVNALTRFLITAMASIRGLKVRNFETLEEGIAFLRTVRDLTL